jgi:hypothetical protein
MIFNALPPLSCGPVRAHTAVPIDESESELGQVLLISGQTDEVISSAVHVVDLATGVCTPQPHQIAPDRPVGAAARLSDGRVVCVGGTNHDDEAEGITAELLESPTEPGSPTSEASWQWRELPGMSSVARFGCSGCVLSDGRFAVFGGHNGTTPRIYTASCEVLTLDGDEQWEQFPPMHEARSAFACAAFDGCVIVAGGDSYDVSGSMELLRTVEVYEEALQRWRRLPCSLPLDAPNARMGSVAC